MHRLIGEERLGRRLAKPSSIRHSTREGHRTGCINTYHTPGGLGSGLIWCLAEGEMSRGGRHQSLGLLLRRRFSSGVSRPRLPSSDPPKSTTQIGSQAVGYTLERFKPMRSGAAEEETAPVTIVAVHGAPGTTRCDTHAQAHARTHAHARMHTSTRALTQLRNAHIVIGNFWLRRYNKPPSVRV